MLVFFFLIVDFPLTQNYILINLLYFPLYFAATASLVHANRSRKKTQGYKFKHSLKAAVQESKKPLPLNDLPSMPVPDFLKAMKTVPLQPVVEDKTTHAVVNIVQAKMVFNTDADTPIKSTTTSNSVVDVSMVTPAIWKPLKKPLNMPRPLLRRRRFN